MPKLQVIIASTRPGRVGLPIGRWFYEFARRQGGFDVEWVDLVEVKLPLMDEPNHPRLRKYTRPHTKAWSEKVDGADAFVFVTPEYNYGSPPALVNALDYLFHEWSYKPAGFVSYGGISGGTRSVQMTKQIVTALKMMPLFEAVTIPMFAQYIDKEGAFVPIAAHEKSATAMLDELGRWAEVLRPLRARR